MAISLISLRKACHACTQAKRKCQPQLPKCSRCLKSGIECNYDLEPLSICDPNLIETYLEKQDPTVLIPTYHVFNSVESAHQAVMKAFNDQFSSHPPPEVRMAGDKDIVEWAISQLRKIPDLIAGNKSSPFLHRQVLQSTEGAMARIDHVLDLHRSIRDGPASNVVPPSRNAHLQHLVRTEIRGLSMEGMLVSIHELFLYLMLYICNDLLSAHQVGAERYIDLMIDWTRHLWAAIPNQLSSSLSPWRAWVVAESARRTILMSFIVKGVFRAVRYGYCVYEPFVEALPFDSCSALWEAMSEEAWYSIIEIHGGKSGVLVSFREFIAEAKLSTIQDEGLFQQILLVGYYQKEALAALESGQ
ncbi:hypothetical protein F5884DRAFT_856265 [Xylogone sp. PMI_703]|nr:hypothetical protein F5884DRAFT_856265 [Xylogone sp. PMI_703]